MAKGPETTINIHAEQGTGSEPRTCLLSRRKRVPSLDLPFYPTPPPRHPLIRMSSHVRHSWSCARSLVPNHRKARETIHTFVSPLPH